MKIKILTAVALFICALFTACDDTTDTIGSSLTDNKDLLKITTATFSVASNSFASGAVYSRNTTGYLGKVRDPETGAYITGDFMTQFGTLENYAYPEQDSIASLSDEVNGVVDGKVQRDYIIADSCSIRLFFTDYYGDSLTTMNLTAYEMATPMEEGVKYYTDFDPKESNLISADGVKVNKTYTLTDLSVSSDDRSSSSYTPNIKINLNKEFTKDGKTYNNYGTYVMQKYYEDGGANNFKNPYNFIHNVCPGFYFEINDGLGSMAYIVRSQLNIYFRYRSDSIVNGMSTFSGTEEVLQSTTITNDNDKIAEMVNSNECTYLKTPAGIFTEMELPVEEIINGHENDTINTAKIVLSRINNSTHSEYSLDIPSTLLMIPKDSLKNFFENGDIVDYKRSFLASYTTSSDTPNCYVFNNISGLVTYMANNMKEGIKSDSDWKSKNADWNKVVIIPVTTTTNSSGQIVKVVHNMSLTSTRLVKGTKNEDSPVKISVVYSKFNY